MGARTRVLRRADTNLMNHKADTGTAWVLRCIERRTSDSVFNESYNVLDEAVSELWQTVKPK